MSEAFVHGAAGTMASMGAMALLFPLENLRIRMQVKDSAETSWEEAQRVLQREGLGGLYRGVRTSVAVAGISSGVYFYWYELLKEQLPSRNLSAAANILVACGAGVLNALVTHPLWTIATQLTLKDNTVLSVVAKEGLVGLYSGIGSALLLVLNPVVQFVVYEQLKAIVLNLKRSKVLTSFQAFLLGAIAKAMATLATYPIQLVKSRLQAGNHVSAAEMVRSILRAHGVSGLFQGLGAKMLQSVLNSAVMFLFYERIVQLVRAQRAVISAVKN